MTDRYAVIGNPVAHSQSPVIHAAFARQTGESLVYERLLAPLDGFAETAKRFFDEGGLGLNVTVPFKHDAWKFVNSHDGVAVDAEAVNTIKFVNGGLIGYNTDGIGLVTDLERNLGCSIASKRVLLMGAGGASRGVMRPVLEKRPALLVVANRTPEKARHLVGHFRNIEPFAACGIRASAYGDLTGAAFDLVINATSSGLSNDMPPLPSTAFAPGALAYDMMYGRETPFMAFAREQGARVADGLGMLVEQAAESFFIWRGVRPETAPVLAALRQQR
jgi:shikimate dehydrogenase